MRLAAGAPVQPSRAKGHVHGEGVRRNHVVYAVQVGQGSVFRGLLPVPVETAHTDHASPLVSLYSERPHAHQPDVHWADAHLSLLKTLLHQVAGVSYPESGVGEHVQEVGIAMSEGDLQPVVGQHVNAFDISQLSFEVGRGADAVSRQAA